MGAIIKGVKSTINEPPSLILISITAVNAHKHASKRIKIDAKSN